ncbi:hypothetical protein IF1G_06255 [Cordyceps javanica]|uniref:Uncharacterized protein n=1 Tax=Cordyceps javanica TaxID=43265 RepID=A0A545V0L8_9HYPO|nr:hypothetical protein IF1G_06255 [Cordyceps javanica]
MSMACAVAVHLVQESSQAVLLWATTNLVTAGLSLYVKQYIQRRLGRVESYKASDILGHMFQTCLRTTLPDYERKSFLNCSLDTPGVGLDLTWAMLMKQHSPNSTPGKKTGAVSFPVLSLSVDRNKSSWQVLFIFFFFFFNSAGKPGFNRVCQPQRHGETKGPLRGLPSLIKLIFTARKTHLPHAIGISVCFGPRHVTHGQPVHDSPRYMAWLCSYVWYVSSSLFAAFSLEPSTSSDAGNFVVTAGSNTLAVKPRGLRLNKRKRWIVE